MNCKSTLFVLLIMIGQMGFAQSLVISDADSIVYGNAYNTTDIEAHVSVKNITSSSIDVKVKRRDVNYSGLTDSNAICWDVCFVTSVSNSPTTITIGAGSSSSKGAFIGHVYPDRDGVPYSDPITYVFYDANNPSDSVEVTIYYAVTQNFSVKEQAVKSAAKVYPNPAGELLNVEYELNTAASGTFEMINVVGNKVYQKNLDSRKGNFGVNVSGLARGVYFYVIRTNGKVAQTRKIVLQ